MAETEKLVYIDPKYATTNVVDTLTSTIKEVSKSAASASNTIKALTEVLKVDPEKLSSSNEEIYKSHGFYRKECIENNEKICKAKKSLNQMVTVPAAIMYRWYKRDDVNEMIQETSDNYCKIIKEAFDILDE